jgi:hypothetical protein
MRLTSLTAGPTTVSPTGRRHETIERRALPPRGGLPLVRAPILDERTLLVTVVPPAEGAACVNGVQCVDERHRPRQLEVLAPAFRAESLNQIGFQRAGQPASHEPGRNAMNVDVAHAPLSA